MCGRFALGVSTDELPSQFHQTALLNGDLHQISDNRYQAGDSEIHTNLENFTSTYNIAPTNVAVIAFRDGPNYVLEASRFGLVPSWAKEPKPGKMFNCRKDTLAKPGSVWTSSKNHRCVVPMSGYFEWNKDRIPYFVHSDAKLIYFAGLYCRGDKSCTFTIVTGPAHPSDKGDLSWLHHRKPIILEPGSSAWDSWLSTKAWSDSLLDALQTDNAYYKVLKTHPVSKDVGRTSSEGEYLIKEVKVKKERSIMGFFKKETGKNEENKFVKEDDNDSKKRISEEDVSPRKKAKRT